MSASANPQGGFWYDVAYQRKSSMGDQDWHLVIDYATGKLKLFSKKGILAWSGLARLSRQSLKSKPTFSVGSGNQAAGKLGAMCGSDGREYAVGEGVIYIHGSPMAPRGGGCDLVLCRDDWEIPPILKQFGGFAVLELTPQEFQFLRTVVDNTQSMGGAVHTTVAGC